MQAIETVSLIKDRIKDQANARPGISRGARAWHSAMELWTAEFESYQALSAVGLHHAAACAWSRRSGASDLCRILTACT
jgi:hypothetical protein